MEASIFVYYSKLIFALNLDGTAQGSPPLKNLIGSSCSMIQSTEIEFVQIEYLEFLKADYKEVQDCLKNSQSSQVASIGKQ